jgi:hypothetical protein
VLLDQNRREVIRLFNGYADTLALKINEECFGRYRNDDQPGALRHVESTFRIRIRNLRFLSEALAVWRGDLVRTPSRMAQILVQK